MAESLQLRGVLKAHEGWVTRCVTKSRCSRQCRSCARSPSPLLPAGGALTPPCSIACPQADGPDILLSSSRDKSVIMWTLTREDAGPTGNYGYARRALRGHSHFVQDVVLSSDGQARPGVSGGFGVRAGPDPLPPALPS